MALTRKKDVFSLENFIARTLQLLEEGRRMQERMYHFEDFKRKQKVPLITSGQLFYCILVKNAKILNKFAVRYC